MSRIVKERIIDLEVLKKLPEEAKTLLLQNDFQPVPTVVVDPEEIDFKKVIKRAFEEGKILSDPIHDFDLFGEESVCS